MPENLPPNVQPVSQPVSLAPPTREVSNRRAFLFLVAVAIILIVLVARPFFEALFFGAVLAGALYPLVTRLTAKLRMKSRGPATLIILLAVLLLLVGPITALVAFIVGQSVEAVRSVTTVLKSEGMTGLVDLLPSTMQRFANWVLSRAPEAQALVDQLAQTLSGQGGKAAAAVGGVLGATGTLVVQTVMMLIALYFFLTDGGTLVHWLEQVSPLKKGQTRELMLEFKRTSGSVIVSTVATAGVQTIAAFVGYLIARMPYPVFFATLTFFIAFIPAVGAGSVVVLAALILLAMGKTGAAIFLAIWGVVVVGLSDNVVKPILVKRGMDLHGAVVFFALLGGLSAFGLAGLVVGPLAVAFFLAVVRIWHRDFGKGPKAAEAVAEATKPDDKPKDPEPA